MPGLFTKSGPGEDPRACRPPLRILPDYVKIRKICEQNSPVERLVEYAG